MGENIDLSQFNSETLKYLVSIAKPIIDDPVSYYTYPNNQADERNIPIISKWPVNGGRINRHHFIIGIEASKEVLPCKIKNFVTWDSFEITEEITMFETPLFTDTLDECGYNPYISRKLPKDCEVNFLIMTLPLSLIKKCGKWWNYIDTDEKFTILSSVPKIKYTIVNNISPVWEK